MSMKTHVLSPCACNVQSLPACDFCFARNLKISISYCTNWNFQNAQNNCRLLI